MVKHVIWALAILASGSWGSAHRYRAEVVAAREPHLLALVEQLRYNTLEVRVEGSVTDQFGQRRKARWHGSGCAVARRNGQLYVLTAKHVTRDAEHISIRAYGGYGKPYRTWLALPCAESETDDLALVIMPDDPQIVVYDVMSDVAFDRLPLRNGAERGALALIAGWPLNITPAQVGIGELISRSYEDEYNRGEPLARIEASIWYGNSGGPAIDARTGQLLGVVVQIRATDDLPDGSVCLIVPAPQVRKFLSNHSLPQ